jgi:YfiH family protein
MWLLAPNIKTTHGFSTRYGGISPAPFDSLNLGGSEDQAPNIKRNRELALSRLGLQTDSCCMLKQVHGNKVCNGEPGMQEGDALVTNKKKLALAVSVADCFPILFHDKKNGVVGAAHAGWRGTAARIASHTIKAMTDLGAKRENIQVAVGQGISFDRFEVGDEVTEQFRKQGFPISYVTGKKVDLAGCNIFTLLEIGIPPANIWHMNRCTFEKDFFSYRRDKGTTGRMWAVIAMQ